MRKRELKNMEWGLLVVAIILSNKYIIVSNILIIGCLIHSIFITRPMYKLYHNKYGYEVYAD